MSFQLAQINTQFPIHLIQEKSNITSTEDRTAELKKVCKDFESIFVAQILKTMRSSIEKSGMFEENTGADIYQSMFDMELSKKIADANGIGLADMLVKSLAGKISGINSDNEFLSVKIDGYKANQPVKNKGSMFDRISRYHQLISNAAQQHNVPIHLIYGVIAQESAGQPDVVSRAGAKGLMQLMDGTAAELGVRNSFDVKENIFGGVAYLKEQINKFNGNVELALAAYNAGPANVEHYGGIPPFEETQDYVRKVLRYTKEFESRLTQMISENI